MNYMIEPSAWAQVFALPSVLVDKYIKLAGKSQLRVILYLLRYPGKDITHEELSNALALHPDEIAQALFFWTDAGVLVTTSGQDGKGTADTKSSPAQPASGDESVSQTPKAEAAAPKENDALPKRPRTVTRSPMNDPAVIAKRMGESQEIKALVEEAEVILGKSLRAWEADVLISLHDVDQMPVDVIVMVLQYAAKREKTTIKYIEATAQNWIEEGVDTIEKAEQKIRMVDQAAGAWKKLSALLHIDFRKPSTKEEEYALTWIEEWKMKDALILLAYDRCVDATGKMKLNYMHKILMKWHEANYATVKQVEEGDTKLVLKEKKTAGKRKNSTPSYDLEAFEQMIMSGERLKNPGK